MDDNKKEKGLGFGCGQYFIAWRVLGSVPMTMETLPGSEVKNRKLWLESIISNLCCWIGHGLLLASLANVGVIS